MKGTIIMRSPCLKCDHRNRDKKHPECINCNDRILYADSIGPMTHSMPIELTNLGGAMNEIAQKECKQPGCEMAGKLQPIDNFPRNARCKDGHLDTCKKCMGKKISNGTKKNSKLPPSSTVHTASKDQSQKHQLLVCFDEYPELLKQLKKVAKKEFRAPEGQVLYWIDSIMRGSQRNEKPITN